MSKVGLILPPEDFDEYKSYLEELIAEYERFVLNIGRNGINAPMLLHYRSEIQDVLDELEGQEDIAPFLEPFYKKLEKLDDELLNKGEAFIKELGGIVKLRQYQWSLRPPTRHWWWYLDKYVKITPQKPNSPLGFLGDIFKTFDKWLSS